ncbi:MAG: galactitol-1-phosphate 5-dehydrogenase [Clostridia bacterium]|nr:galactitol-1-phosphate 5-dehydrogenase [Clostridia bacterium]
MKACVLHGNEDLRYEEYPTPEVREVTVRVKVKAAGICGSDIPRVLGGGAHFYPIVLGHEFSGIIDAIGEGVSGLSVGDTVSVAPLIPCMRCPDCLMGNYALCRHYSFIGSREQGAFADYVVVPAMNVIRYDPSIPFEQAAMFEPSTVALHGLLISGYTGGDCVAILGGGTIGLFTMQWAKIFGSRRVVVFDIVPERLELALRLGADAVVNTATEDVSARVAALTDGRGFGRVFETAGNPVTSKMAFSVASNGASVCFIGTPTKSIEFSPKEWELLNRKGLHLTGSWMSYSASFPGKEWELTAHYFATGQLKFDDALIDRRFPMRDAARAFELYKTPHAVKGKLMLFNE